MNVDMKGQKRELGRHSSASGSMMSIMEVSIGLQKLDH